MTESIMGVAEIRTETAPLPFTRRGSERGYARGWGLGRHVLGSNYFHYVRDPWGSYSEFSCGIDYIPAGLLWTASRPDPQNSLYLWGPPPPEDFTENYEL